MWTLLILYLLLALGVSFMCSMLEAGVLSLTRAQIDSLREKHPKAAKHLKKMKNEIDRPLAAILTFNTVAHTIGAAGVGAEAAEIFGSQWTGLVGAVLTVLILLLSEIIPKTLGAVHAVKLAPVTAFLVRTLVVTSLPVVWVCEWVSRMAAQGAKPPPISRDEVISVAKLGEDEGAVSSDELRIIRNLLHLHHLQIKDIMTPRNVVFALQEDTRIGDALEQKGLLSFARIPVYGDSLDEIKGLVHRYRVLEAGHAGQQDEPVSTLARPVHVVPENASVEQAMEQFFEKRDHLFQVVDEFGGTAGIVTLEDTIETLLGVEIVDETDTVADMQQLAKSIRQQYGRRVL